MTNRLPAKPQFGAVCNGCGLCCAKELCVVGEMAFPGAQAPCPALKLSPDGTRTYCEFVMFEKFGNLNPIIQEGLGIGTGCSMPDESTERTA